MTILPGSRAVRERWRPWALAVALSAVLCVAMGRAAGGGVAPARRAGPAPTTDSAGAALWMEMRHVRLRIDAGSAMRVQELRGRAVGTAPGTVPLLDDPRSFGIAVTAGTVALDGPALAALLNEVVFAYPHAPLSHLRVRVTDTGIVQSGVLHKGVPLRFTMAATLALQPDGRLRLHPTALRLLGVDGERLLRALHLRLAGLLDVRGARGVAVAGDDLLLDPLAMIPPPAVHGRVAAVRVAHGEVVLAFARTAADSVFGAAVRPDDGARNFVYFRGGRLRFGRLEMRDTDLLIRDADERDPFDLYLPHYAEQLAAGYSRTLPNAALRVVMPDWHALPAAAPPHAQPATASSSIALAPP